MLQALLGFCCLLNKISAVLPRSHLEYETLATNETARNSTVVFHRSNLTIGNYVLKDGEGGLPTISDGVFSLVVMLYVALTFIFVFFTFCWRRGVQPEHKEGGYAYSCPLNAETQLKNTSDVKAFLFETPQQC